VTHQGKGTTVTRHCCCCTIWQGGGRSSWSPQRGKRNITNGAEFLSLMVWKLVAKALGGHSGSYAVVKRGQWTTWPGCNVTVAVVMGNDITGLNKGNGEQLSLSRQQG